MKRNSLILSFSGLALLLALVGWNSNGTSTVEVETPEAVEAETAMMFGSITESIPACMPAAHPYGRYHASVNCSNGCNWELNYGNILDSGNTYCIVEATSIGWFTLKIKDNSGNVLASQNFYADSCPF